jgi:hypothetical protein
MVWSIRNQTWKIFHRQVRGILFLKPSYDQRAPPHGIPSERGVYAISKPPRTRIRTRTRTRTHGQQAVHSAARTICHHDIPHLVQADADSGVRPVAAIRRAQS